MTLREFKKIATTAAGGNYEGCLNTATIMGIYYPAPYMRDDTGIININGCSIIAVAAQNIEDRANAKKAKRQRRIDSRIAYSDYYTQREIDAKAAGFDSYQHKQEINEAVQECSNLLNADISRAKMMPMHIEADGVVFVCKKFVSSRKKGIVTLLNGLSFCKKQITEVSLTHFFTIARRNDLKIDSKITNDNISFVILPINPRILGYPDFISSSGSKYYDTVWGKIRVSDHWGYVGTSIYEVYGGDSQRMPDYFPKKVACLELSYLNQ